MFLAVTTISFDIAALELYLPMIVGAHIVLVSREVACDAGQLVKPWLNLALQSCSSSYLATTLRAGWQGNKQLKILCGGTTNPRTGQSAARKGCSL